jgi:hypothetical protein
MRSGPNSVEPGGDLVRLRHCDAADHDAGDAEREQFLGHLARADAAADLDGVPAGTGGDALDRVTVALRAVARAVEVDDVDLPRAQCAVAIEHVERVGGIDGLGVEAALQQAHALAAAQVDGGNQQHQPSSRKLARTRAPGWAERSG